MSQPTESFGQLLYELRLTRGISQRQLGRQLGLDGSAITRYENGSRSPPTRAEFYRALKSVLRLTEAESQMLMAAAGLSPRALLPPGGEDVRGPMRNRISNAVSAQVDLGPGAVIEVSVRDLSADLKAFETFELLRVAIGAMKQRVKIDALGRRLLHM